MTTDNVVEVLRRLPEQLRPNPTAVRECIELAVGDGWTIDQIVNVVRGGRHQNPATVVSAMRSQLRIPPYQPTASNTITLDRIRHAPCPDPTHEPRCELCRCVPGEVTHHVSDYGRIPQ